ncbi:cupin domain-containing protein [Antrihabitans stalactiti]|uniref:Cupin domain-containing protein n=1 Tax=Antrihabitans stalactiti TaxID=2584121 RepID=A0A848KE28_9NOCA|nr:cupin domain-containing protein [Antrihabitans stalactiti]NMN96006.1 cupin domain-containing protein [Antrihabitans stalactiti]
MRRSLQIALVVTPLVAGALYPGAAQATPSSGVTGVILTQAQIPAGLVPMIAGAADVVVREITIAPGGTTGWHYHDGPIYAYVRAGTLTHPDEKCVPAIYNAGQIINEPPGADKVHAGFNLGTTPVILDVVYTLPAGKPLSEDAPAPSCAAS